MGEITNLRGGAAVPWISACFLYPLVHLFCHSTMSKYVCNELSQWTYACRCSWVLTANCWRLPASSRKRTSSHITPHRVSHNRLSNKEHTLKRIIAQNNVNHVIKICSLCCLYNLMSDILSTTDVQRFLSCFHSFTALVGRHEASGATILAPQTPQCERGAVGLWGPKIVALVFHWKFNTTIFVRTCAAMSK